MAQRRKPPSFERRLRRLMEEWFPTLVHYAGIVLMAYAVAVDQGRHLAFLTAATGMILYKVVAGRGDGGE
jgi:hypothetical protein